jgi:hypothetical protein
MPTILSSLLESEQEPLLLGQPVWVVFTVKNETSAAVTVANPYVGKPSVELNWPFSDETYQIALLQSFGLLSLSVIHAAIGELANVGPQTWITPLMPAPLELAPGDSLRLRINLSDFFELNQAGRYRVTVEYGDEHARAKADAELSIEEQAN